MSTKCCLVQQCINSHLQISGWRQTYYRRGQQAAYYRNSSSTDALKWGVMGGAVWKVLEGGAVMVGVPDGNGWSKGDYW